MGQDDTVMMATCSINVHMAWDDTRMMLGARTVHGLINKTSLDANPCVVMCVYIKKYTYIFMYIWKHVWAQACIYVCIHIFTYLSTSVLAHTMFADDMTVITPIRGQNDPG